MPEAYGLGQERREILQRKIKPIPNTRNRGHRGDSTLPLIAPALSTARSIVFRAYHARRASLTAREWSDVKTSDSFEEGPYTYETELSRGQKRPKLNLYDPKTDSGNTSESVRRKENQDIGNLARQFQQLGVNPLLESPFQPLSQQEQALVQKDPSWAQLDFPHNRQTTSKSLIAEQSGDGIPGEPPTEQVSIRYGDADPLESEPEMLLQPETRPISHEQLVVEVKGIYAGLVMVEAKCIDIDERQSMAAQEKDPARKVNLKNDQWQSLIALHKQLLHEHHDFFPASQHPSASPALSRLAAKYSMPARMWRHGIHAFLEVLRHRLPESLEHMLAFIYITYSMMALLYETVSTFEDTWIECLGENPIGCLASRSAD